MSFVSPLIELRNRLFSYFKIEEKNFPDKKAYVQASINLSFVLVYASCWFMYVILYFFLLKNTLAGAMCLFAGLPSALLGAWLVKAKQRYYMAGVLANLGGCITLCGITIATGGIYSPIPAWLFFLTMTTFLCNGARMGALMVGLNVLGVAVIGALHIKEVIGGSGFDFGLNTTEYKIFAIWVFGSSLAALGVVTSVYDYLVRRAFLEVSRAKEKVEAKNRDIRAILKNISAGIFTITPEQTIHEDHSDHLREILGQRDLAGKDAVSTMFQKTTASMNEVDQIRSTLQASLGEDVMNYDLNKHCLPSEAVIVHNDEERIVEINWDPILDRKDQVEKILVSMKDVTEQRQLRRQAERQQENLAIMQELVDIEHEQFLRLYQAASRFIEHNKHLIACNEQPGTEIIKMLFINMHTIKGDARTLRLTRIVERAHETENRYALLQREGRRELWNRADMQEELDELQAYFDLYSKIATEKLGRSEQAPVIKFGHEELLEKLKLLEGIEQTGMSLTARATLNQVRQFLRDRLYDRCDDVFSEFQDHLARLARDLSKETPVTQIQAHDYLLNEQGSQLLRKVFIHLIRNAMDHGIESVTERQAKGKDPHGQILLRAEEAGSSTMRIYFNDDGRGLNVNSIRAKGVAKGLCRENDSLEKIVNLIFESDFSTTTAVTEISGRGMGMDAVRKYLSEEGGRIDLILDAKVPDAQGFIPFHFELYIPQHLWEKAA